MNRRTHILIIIFILSLIGTSVFAQDIDKSKVIKVKAGILYNITKTITWPEGSFVDDEPLSILFLGKDYNEMGRYFESQVRFRSLTVQGRNISVKQLTQTKLDDVVEKELGRTNILYIMSSYNGSIAELLHAIGKRPVLIVGDSSKFPIEGAMIGIDVEGDNVSISANLDAIKNTSLKISAQLLQHAKIVRGTNE